MTSPTATLVSRNPWDNTPIGEYPVATRQEISAALQKARHALKDWSHDSSSRQHIIARLGEIIKSKRSDLATLISRETGKVYWESLLEADAMANKCSLSLRAEQERRLPISKEAATGTLATTYRPHGIALVLGPFNFPGHLPLGHIAPALLAGNTVLFKPSEKAPAVAELLLSYLKQAGLPEHAVQVLHGGPEVASQLISKEINAVLFTGSYEVGTKILAQLTTRPGVLTALEMGGNNPLIAWELDEKSLPAAVLTILQSAFATAGQRCSCARRLIIPAQTPLLDAVIQAARQIAVGSPFAEPQPFYASLINAQAVDQVRKQCEIRYADGARYLLEGQFDPDHPTLLTPIILDSTRNNSVEKEVFGPLLEIVRVSTFDEALQAANATQYGLVAGLLTDNPKLWERFRFEARAGVLTLNRPTNGASSELPFGGIGNSGNHRPSAYFAADYCSYPVAEMTSPALTLPDKLPPGVTL